MAVSGWFAGLEAATAYAMLPAVMAAAVPAPRRERELLKVAAREEKARDATRRPRPRAAAKRNMRFIGAVPIRPRRKFVRHRFSRVVLVSEGYISVVAARRTGPG